MSLMEENFEEAAKLDPGAAVKVQAVVRCLEDNTTTRIKLRDATAGGRSVQFDLVAGDMVDLDDCCDLRGVQRNNNQLEA